MLYLGIKSFTSFDIYAFQPKDALQGRIFVSFIYFHQKNFLDFSCLAFHHLLDSVKQMTSFLLTTNLSPGAWAFHHFPNILAPLNCPGAPCCETHRSTKTLFSPWIWPKGLEVIIIPIYTQTIWHYTLLET